MTEADIETEAGWTGTEGLFVSTLLDIRFLDKPRRGPLKVHDWMKWNSWSFHAKERRRHAQKAAKVRWDKRFNNLDACGEHKRAMLKSKTGNAPSPTPSPTPSPIPNPDPDPTPVRKLADELTHTDLKETQNQKLADFREWKRKHLKDLYTICQTYNDFGGLEFVRSHTLDIEADIVLNPEKYQNINPETWGRYLRSWLRHAAKDDKMGSYGRHG